MGQGEITPGGFQTAAPFSTFELGDLLAFPCLGWKGFSQLISLRISPRPFLFTISLFLHVIIISSHVTNSDYALKTYFVKGS